MKLMNVNIFRRIVYFIVFFFLFFLALITVNLLNSRNINDVNSIENLELVFNSNMELSPNLTYIIVSNSVAYISSASDGLFVVDVHDAKNPLLLDNIKLDGVLGRIWIDGSVAYVSAGKQGFHIVDIRELSNLVLKQTVSVPGTLSDIIVFDNYVYTASWDKGVYIFDGRNTIDPLNFHHIDIKGRSSVLKVVNNMLLVGTVEGLLQIFDMKDLEKPLLRKSLNISEEPNYVISISIQANHIFVGLENGWKKIDMNDIDRMDIIGWYGNHSSISSRESYQFTAIDNLLIANVSVRKLGSDIGNTLQLLKEANINQYMVIGEKYFEENITSFFAHQKQVYIITREGDLQIFSVMSKK